MYVINQYDRAEMLSAHKVGVSKTQLSREYNCCFRTVNIMLDLAETEVG